MENFFAWAAYVQGSLLAFLLEGGVLEISHRPTTVYNTERPGTSSEELQCAYSELRGCRSRRSRINIMTTAFWKLLGQPQLV